jgi:hypothetical protein
MLCAVRRRDRADREPSRGLCNAARVMARQRCWRRLLYEPGTAWASRHRKRGLRKSGLPRLRALPHRSRRLLARLPRPNDHTNHRGGPTASPGTPVRDGELEFVVSDVSTPVNWRGDPRPRGQWIIATMTVRNLDDDPQEFVANNQKLIDSAGHTYAADAMAAVT